MTTSSSQLERDLRELEALSQSRGWAILQQAIKDDIIRASLDLASDPRMAESEMHYRRGALFAASNFLSIVDRLHVKLENESLLAKANAGSPLNNPDATAQGDL